MQDEHITEDTLFLACTRPAMVLGVPVEAMALNVMVSGTIFLAANNLAYLSVGVALHFIFRAVVKHDHNAFRVLFMWLETKGRARNRAWWGGSSHSPLPVVRHFSAKDFPNG